MELSQDFSLLQEFHWEEPIGEMAQVSISTYGCDDDRIRLANHFSVSVGALEAMSELSAPEVRLAVASNPHTPPLALKVLAKDRTREVRVAAIHTISALPPHLQVLAKSASESPLQALRNRRSA
jgi:hypothetical protein